VEEGVVVVAYNRLHIEMELYPYRCSAQEGDFPGVVHSVAGVDVMELSERCSSRRGAFCYSELVVYLGYKLRWLFWKGTLDNFDDAEFRCVLGNL
jgi:hypothetical protein